MNQTAMARGSDAASDLRFSHEVYTLLRELNKAGVPFWGLPQPEFQNEVTGFRNKKLMPMSRSAHTKGRPRRTDAS